GAAVISGPPWVVRGPSQFNKSTQAAVRVVVLVLIGVIADRK
ncbi:DUF3392 domain-containing protein, partial [Pseudomonas syringae]